MTCQLCQEAFSVPSGGFAPHPFAGRKAVSKQCEEKEMFCHEDHDQPQKAVAYCQQCPGAVCEECVQVHRSMKALKSHSPLPLDRAMREGSLISKETFICLRHKEKQKLYCTECEALICALCHSVGDHKSHSVLFVDNEIGELNKSTLKSCIASAERHIDKMTGALGQVGRSIDVLHQQSENAKEVITRLIDHLIAILRVHKAALVGEVDQLEERASTELHRHKEKVIQQLTIPKQCKLLTEDLLQHGTLEEQIYLKKDVVQRVATVTAAPLLAPPAPCTIHIDAPAIKERFENELCQLVSLMRGTSSQSCTIDDLPTLTVEGVLLVSKLPLKFTVVTRDKDNKLSNGGDQVLATLSPSSCGVPVVGAVKDGENGTYQVEFNTCPAPHCKLSVTVNGRHTKGSPLMVQVYRIQPIGQVVEAFRDPSVELRYFRALTVDKNGFIFATDARYKEVCVFNQTGCVVRHSKVTSSAIIDGIAQTQDGNIAVSDSSNSVRVYTANGQFVQRFSCNRPSGLAVNSQRQWFVVQRDSFKVSVFSQNGKHQYSIGSPGNHSGLLMNPEQICIAPDGLVYVSDAGNNRVQVFEQDGTFIQQFGKNILHYPTGIAATKDGHIVVASQGANKLSIFTLDGQCVREVTNVGLNSPYGVAIDACGWVYVADCDNHRILKL